MVNCSLSFYRFWLYLLYFYFLFFLFSAFRFIGFGFIFVSVLPSFTVILMWYTANILL